MPPETTRGNAVDQKETTGYLLLSASLDGHPGPASQKKLDLLATLKLTARQLRRDLCANVGILTARQMAPHSTPAAPAAPPGSAEPAGSAGSAGPVTDGAADGAVAVHQPGYDVAVLLQVPTVESAQWLTADPAFADLQAMVGRVATDTHVAVIHNVRPSHCEYGAQSRRLYLLMHYLPGDRREVLPAWGWTHRHELLADLAFSPALRKFRHPGPEQGRAVLFELA